MTPQELQEENPVLDEDALNAMQKMTSWKCVECGEKATTNGYCLKHQIENNEL